MRLQCLVFSAFANVAPALARTLCIQYKKQQPCDRQGVLKCWPILQSGSDSRLSRHTHFPWTGGDP